MTFSIDRGGTFTDVYAEHAGVLYVEKLLSEDPDNYADAPTEAIRRILKKVLGVGGGNTPVPAAAIDWIRMGTTVATNALLEHKGATTALLITRGFGDLLRIGYQNRPELFALDIHQPEMLYARVVEIDERVTVEGEGFAVAHPLDETQVKAALSALKADGIKSIAVAFMHAYGCDTHERRVRTLAQEAGFEQVSLSSAVEPTIKIVERAQSCVVDAYLTPHVRRYVEGFRRGFDVALADKPVDYMQSFGGLCDGADFSGINAILSGPAGGVVGLASLYRGQPLIGFDMGGTSTDVSRYDGRYELGFEHRIAGVDLKASQLQIKTVAAGGGSRLFYRHGMFVVGPESAGGHPGPVCYKKGGYLSVTDANAILGRLRPEYFPAIFGPDADEPLGIDESRAAFEALAATINDGRDTPLTIEQIALAFLRVANDAMVKPIKAVSSQQGYALHEHHLVPFGGAGAQHACAIARMLGIREVVIHAHAGIFCAYGLSRAERITRLQQSVRQPLEQFVGHAQQNAFAALCGGSDHKRYLHLRYERSEQLFLIDDLHRPRDAFEAAHRQAFGFLNNDRIIVEAIQAEIVTSAPAVKRPALTRPAHPLQEAGSYPVYFDDGWQTVPFFRSETLYADATIAGPAVIIDATSTILIEPKCDATVDALGDIHIRVGAGDPPMPTAAVDAQWLPIFGNLFASTAEQMGHVLQRTAVSTNIKERLDFSCALFDARGDLVANAPHIPVHLGSMSATVKVMLSRFGDTLRPGDVFISNAPFEGGSHLPDITVISPHCDASGRLRYVTAGRGHHADVGGITPGSMPPDSTRLGDEGTVITMRRAVKDGVFQEAELRRLFAEGGARKCDENIADIKAQIAANQRGLQLLASAAAHYGTDVLEAYMGHIQHVSAEAVRRKLMEIADHGVLKAEDRMDDGSRIALTLRINPDTGDTHFDFTECADQSRTNQNAPLSVTYSAVIYALRCLIDEPLPLNGGFLAPVTITVREGSILNPDRTAAVVGGNVTTSQRIVDVIFQAFGIVADSSGCMNNLTFGNAAFGYYETIGGGAGAGEGFDGASGVHTHMTNTRITDPEILEQRYPVVLEAFALRSRSGGAGKWRGGDGLIRRLRFCSDVDVSLLTERRRYAPHGAKGGEAGRCGENRLIRGDETHVLPAQTAFAARGGDVLEILTPGGGGFGPG